MKKITKKIAPQVKKNLIDSNTENNKPIKSQRNIIAGCIILLLIAIIAVPIIIYRASNAIDNQAKIKTALEKTKDVTDTALESTQDTTAETATYNSYPTPQDCSQVEIPSSSPLSFSVNDPGIKKNLGDHYYSIYAYTAEDLKNQVRSCGPKQDGSSYAGMATSMFSWIFRYQYTPTGACQITDVGVGINVDIYYPNWEIIGDVQPGLPEKWQAYMNALTTHEHGHKQRHYDTADRIFNSANGLTAATCEEAGNVVGAIVDNIIAENRADNIAYDEETGHGATQGAIMP